MEELCDKLQSTSENDWSVSQNKRFRASIIIWGMPKSLSTLEIRAKLADIGLASFARGSVAWEGDHVRLLLLPKDSKGLSKDVVGRISACLRKIGCRCVLDESQKAWESAGVQVNIACSNRFSSLVDEDVYVGGELSIDVVRQEACEVQRVRFARKLKIATWNFAGLCSERKQKEISEVLNRVKVDIVAGQETWERKDKVVNVDGYKWFGKPRIDQNSRRGRGRGWLFSS